MPLVEKVFDEIGFDLKHFHVVASVEEMRNTAEALGMGEAATSKYSETTQALRIAPDPQDNLPDLQIIIRYPFANGLYQGIRDQVFRWEEGPHRIEQTGERIDELFDHGADDRMVLFLILHEVGHDQYRHIEVTDDEIWERQEREADHWALGKMDEAGLTSYL